MSNHDEFQPLLNVSGVRVVWARSPAQLRDADWVILPGSKATAADLNWMRQQGLDAAVVAHARVGQRVLGICGGLQMLGEALVDVHGVDGNAAGLGLLPLVTLFAPEKTVRRAQVHLPALGPAWGAAQGVDLAVYEIHHGQTQLRADMEALQSLPTQELVPGMVWQSAQGHVWGTYWHGMFENASLLKALFGASAQSLDDVFARMAQGVDEWFQA